jgi:hypothetical protein
MGQIIHCRDVVVDPSLWHNWIDQTCENESLSLEQLHGHDGVQQNLIMGNSSYSLEDIIVLLCPPLFPPCDSHKTTCHS